MKLSFHGADRDVTGSCHLVESGGRRILIDCGLYQGRRELVEENAEPFGFDASSIDYVLLTHAHLDHCGRLPLLVKRGFHGEIVTTAASRELARLVMLAGTCTGGLRASIHAINGFSAHADQAELVAWDQQIGAPAHTFLVHGEQETMRHFAGHLKNTRVEMPALHEEFELGCAR